MARTRTVSELIDKARRRANIERETTKFSNTLMLDFVDSAWAEYRDFVVQYDQNAFLTTSTISTVSGQDTYALPSNFLHLVRLDLQESSTKFRTIYRFNPSERNAHSDSSPFVRFRYSREGTNVVFVPIPPAGKTVRVYYIPTADKLSSLSTEIDGVNGWEELIVLYTVRRIKVVQGLSTTAVENEIARQEARILNACAIRDSWQPERLDDWGIDWWSFPS